MKKYILHRTLGDIETHIDFRGNLNDQQYEVVTEAEGPCLVLAGAGSGKTRTLIYRLAYLLERGVPPRNILLMTFTNKAANEMRSRTEQLLKYHPSGLWSGTFHHVGNRSIRMHAGELGFSPDFGILDADDSRDLIKACVKKVTGKSRDNAFPKPKVMQSIISLSVNTGVSTEDLIEDRYSHFRKFIKEIGDIERLYAQKKKESGTMDYDDLLSKWKWLLENVPSVRKKFADQFEYIMVDEYQDTNFLQADIVDMLGSSHGNVLVVGDDAQSIYSFRGARVENILSFPRRFPEARVFRLEVNYRSTPDILNLANESLSRNREQFRKDLRAVNPSIEIPALVEVDDLYAQAAFVAQRVTETSKEGAGMGQTAVLFRAHYQSAELEMELTRRGIPYVVRGGIRFFEQAHIKDVLTYLRIVSNPSDEAAWLRALSLYPGIGPGYASKIYAAFRSSGRDLMPFIRSHSLSGVVPPRALKGYEAFRKVMRLITSSDLPDAPADMIETVLENGYGTYLLANFDNARDRTDDIHEVVNFAHEYASLRDFLNDITLRESFKGEVNADPSGEGTLILSTIHQAKGLEWDTVMVIGLAEGQFPHSRALGSEAELEEERRLFYVASTRARKHLYLIHPASRYDHREGMVFCRRSRFLEELDPSVYETWEVSSSTAPRQSRFQEDTGDNRDIERYFGLGDFEDKVIELD